QGRLLSRGTDHGPPGATRRRRAPGRVEGPRCAHHARAVGRAPPDAVTAPRAKRPHMPGYGISTARKGLLPWSWALERLRDSHDYWIATPWPDGRPHVMPGWGVWLQDALWFSSSPGSRKTRNLEADPRCVATTDDALNPVVVEGTATRRRARADIARFTRAV